MFSRTDLRPACQTPVFGPGSAVALSPACKLALGLVAATAGVTAGLLLAAAAGGLRAADRLGCINEAGQLRYRTLLVQQAGADPAAAWGGLQAVRAELAAARPAELAATDPAWAELTAAVAAGPVPAAVADRHVAAADALTAGLEAAAGADAARAVRLLQLAGAGFGLTLAAGGLLGRRMRRTAGRFAEKEAHFRQYLDSGLAAAYVKDGFGELVYTNQVCRDRFDLHAGDNEAAHFPPDVLARLHAVDRKVLATGRAVVTEECVPDPAGQVTHWLSHKFPLRFADGRRLLGGLSVEVTAQKRAEAALRASEGRLRAVVGALPVLVHVVDASGVVVLDEGRGLAAVGRRPGDGVGRRWEETTGTGAESLARLRRALAGEAVTASVERDGRRYDVSYLPQQAGGAVTEVVVLAVDVTDRADRLIRAEALNAELAAARAELHEQARRDPLTGLYNRRALDERLAEDVARAARQGTPLAVVLADVDHFKRLNDALGHPAGDRTLTAVAGALAGAVREVDTAARYGGEEFCVLLPDTDAAGGRAAAERLRAAVAGCGAARPVTASFGVAAWTPGAGDGLDLLAAADQALYRAKAAGRNRVMVAARTAVTA